MSASIQRILFPTDFSEPSKYAKRYACMIAGPMAADLHVLHVIPELMPVLGPEGSWVMPANGEVMKQLIHEAKCSVVKEMHDSGIQGSRILPAVEFGNTVETILKYVETHNIDLIVLGTHGRTGISHVLIGSVAEKIVRLARCPVLTVHPQDLNSVTDRPPQH